MTGLGLGSARRQGCTLRVELRSVNHRFLDLNLRMPSLFNQEEQRLREKLADAIDRGRVTVGVEFERDQSSVKLEVNDVFIAAYIENARKLARKHKLDPHVELDRLLALPEALRVREAELPQTLLRELLGAATDQALKRFQAMRDREGKQLAQELTKRLGVIEAQTQVVKRHAAKVPDEIRRRLDERLERLNARDAVDPSRLAAEVALLVDRASITEEIERLESHCKQFRSCLTSKGPVAKRMGFLLQEMHREVNTTGSKSNDLAITKAVLLMKEELEGLREQIQNLE
jgi:uncharacterized protein (TIGR00255 family)